MTSCRAFAVESVLSALAGMADVRVRQNLPLSRLSAWGIGGNVDLLVTVETIGALRSVICVLREKGVPWMVLGATTNLLFLDDGVPGALVCLGRGFSNLRNLTPGVFAAGAGLWVPRFARAIAQYGWSGVEHTIGVPGTLGGLIAMNGGSQRKCIGDQINEVTAVTHEGERVVLSAKECEFSRRRSVFQENLATVVSATFKFTVQRSYSDARVEMMQIMASRRAKFPMDRPNCGSVFVSDPATFDRYGPPGYLIEQCGLKGTVVGGAQISMKHANFIVNNGGATAQDVLSLIALCIRSVRSKFGVTISTEVKAVGRCCRVRNAGELALELCGGF